MSRQLGMEADHGKGGVALSSGLARAPVCLVATWGAVLAAAAALTAAALEPVSVPPTHSAPALVRLDHAPATDAERALPLVLWTEVTPGPEPVVAWLLRVDLQSPEYKVVSMPAADPDGEGPAEAALTDPLELAQRFGALAAVNANAFGRLPGPDGKVEEGRWRAGQAVDIAGLVVSTGVVRSLPKAQQGSLLAFWIDTAGQAHMGPFAGDAQAVAEGCNAWWIDLVAEGRVLPKPGGERHPRTAAGLDATGRWLLFAVVDGRQPRHSVGMTAAELAGFMLAHDCRRAINLDGGGSSILLAAGAGGRMQILNKPSDGKPRPLPVLVGVTQR